MVKSRATYAVRLTETRLLTVYVTIAWAYVTCMRYWATKQVGVMGAGATTTCEPIDSATIFSWPEAVSCRNPTWTARAA